jgi:hypothetical protein
VVSIIVIVNYVIIYINIVAIEHLIQFTLSFFYLYKGKFLTILVYKASKY